MIGRYHESEVSVLAGQLALCAAALFAGAAS